MWILGGTETFRLFVPVSGDSIAWRFSVDECLCGFCFFTVIDNIVSVNEFLIACWLTRLSCILRRGVSASCLSVFLTLDDILRVFTRKMLERLRPPAT